SYVFLGSRIVRGWAIELVLVAMLLPFAVAAVDLFARTRRYRIPIAPALRSYRSRLAFWLWLGFVFAVLFAAGIWPSGSPPPPGGAGEPRRRQLGRAPARAPRGRGARGLARRARPAPSAASGDRRGGARRPGRGAPRARRRRPARRRHEPVRPRVPAPGAPR